MVDTSIIRNPTTEEKRDFTPLANARPKKKLSVEEQFKEDIGLNIKKASQKGLPFAEVPCRNDFYDHYNQQVKLSVRKNGFLDPEDIKNVKVDWDKYSDLKNFELIEEGDQYDEELTKRNPGLHVACKFKKYRYKGYSNIYIIMEDGPSAVKRAQERNRAQDVSKK